MDFNPQSPYVITGIQAGWDPKDPSRRRPLRREIDEWYTSIVREDQDQVYLFVHALSFFQKVSSDKKLSYFQIAGK
jgi:tyrosinase